MIKHLIISLLSITSRRITKPHARLKDERSAVGRYCCVSELQDQSRVYGCMFALRILARKYEFRDSEEREALDQVVEATFPSILTLVQVKPKEGPLRLPYQ